MPEDALEKLWRAMDAHRGRRSLDALTLAQIVRDERLEIRADDLREIIRRMGSHWGELYCPAALGVLIERLVFESPPHSILDPWAGAGTLLIPLAECTHATGVAIYPNEAAVELGRSVTTDADLSWTSGDPLILLEQLTGSFDLVASCLPLGGPSSRVELSPALNRSVKIQDDRGHLVLLKACQQLSEDGVGIFLVSPRFVTSAKSKGVYAQLSDFGFRLDSYLSLPPRFLSPLTNVLTAIVVIRRGDAPDIFVGEWSDNPESTDVLLKNWRGRKPGRGVALGALIPKEDFRGFHPLAAEERINQLARVMGLHAVALSEIADAINLTKESQPPGFEERPNCVYLPMIGRSDALASLSDMRLKPHNYAQIVVNPEAADASYLAGLFNTPLGLAIRDSALSGTTIPKLTKSSIQALEVFLPDSETQSASIMASVEIRNLINELRELEEQVWSRPREIGEVLRKLRSVNHEERFSDWLDTLPFPLASILWTYHASADDEQRHYEHLLHFFEALSEFLATVLLSGFRSDTELFAQEILELGEAMQRQALSLDRSTFGTWVAIVERLAKHGRSLINSGSENLNHVREMFSVNDDRVLEVLFSPGCVSLMKETTALRNLWVGHGGVVGDAEARQRHMTLAEQLAKLRSLFGTVWDRYELIKPRQASFRSGQFVYSVERLMGLRSAPFEAIEVTVADAMEDGQLHLLATGEPRALKLLPLIKVMPSPTAAQNACYFYNRRQGEKLRFVSYHFETEAEVVEAFSDTESALRLLEG